jgi:uncharacterized protein (TIGR03437 family)
MTGLLVLLMHWGIRDANAQGWPLQAASGTRPLTAELAISPSVLPHGNTDAEYTATLQASGGTAPYTWSISAGLFPPGLAFRGAGGTAVLSGRPLAGGGWTFTIALRDAAGATRVQEYWLPVFSSFRPPEALPDATVGIAYERQVALSGTVLLPPFEWNLLSGALPAGLTVSRYGLVSGIPIQAGNNAFTLGLYDALDRYIRSGFTLRVLPPPIPRLTITTTAIPPLITGVAANASIVASGGVPPRTFSLIAGSLARGLTLNSNGAITGTPEAGGEFTVTVQVADSTGQRVSRQYTIMVAANPAPAISSVVNGASFAAAIAPGSWVTIFGRNLAPDSGTGRLWRVDEIVGGSLPFSLDRVSVTINGRPAAISWVGPDQLNVQAPDDSSTGPVAVQLTTRTGTTAATAQLQVVAPALFSATDALGKRRPAALHADGSPVTAESPAAAGEIVLFYGSGFGRTSPARPAGRLIEPARLAEPFSVTIGALNARVEWGGITAPGLYQFNVEVPFVPAGDHAVMITIGGFSTQAGVTIPVR